MELTPDNIFNYQVINNSGSSRDVTIHGTVRYKNSSMRFSYSFTTVLNAGVTMFSRDKATSPIWDFSSSALQELFFNYRKLPQGTYEYCVEVSVHNNSGDISGQIPINDCIYQRVDDIFLINLIDPENNAKIYEHYPMLSWIVNYPFASELSYRVRVAELKEGQSDENAITRNNPVYQDNNVLSTGIVYPVTAKPLEIFQPYVWTVDAYYKGILLGGAEVWKFTIIEDSLLKNIPREQSYYEFATHNGDTRLYAVGELKLKYLSDLADNVLSLQLLDVNDKEVKLPSNEIKLKAGDNRILIPLKDRSGVKHFKKYNLHITTKDNKSFIVPFVYVNPDYLN
jgi:hypothetical protein